jgi:hypothetical protein
MNDYNYIFDIEEIILILKQQAKKWIISTSLICLVGLIWVLWLPEEYTAGITLAPAKSEKDSALYALSPSDSIELGGITSSLGLTGNGASTETNIALVALESWSFVDQFLRKHNYEDEILSISHWDKNTNELIYYPMFDPITQSWEDPELVNAEWFRWELFKEFIKEVDIVYKKNGLAEIYFTHFSPKLAAKILSDYVDELNDYLQTRKLTILNKNIKNLEAQLASSFNNNDLRQKLNIILAQQIRSKVLAEAADEFAFVKVDRVMVPYKKSAPKRTVLMIGIAIVGTIFSMLIVLLMHFFRNFRLTNKGN